MSKKKDGVKINYVSSSHGKEDHNVVPLWKGSIQPTNGSELVEEADSYDLSVFLSDNTFFEGVPFVFNLSPAPIKALPRMVLFPFKDGGIPEKEALVKEFLNIIVADLKKGAKVGMACIGGHGRTGTIISILYAMAHGIKENPISKVREIVGCEKEVETRRQEEYIYEMVGFPTPEKFLLSKYSYVQSGGYTSSWWEDASGQTVNPLKLEPSLYKGKVEEFGKFKFAYIVTEDLNKKEWAIPIAFEKGTKTIPNTNRVPEFICDVCQGAKGFAMPIHKGSHLTCVVCPLLESEGFQKKTATPVDMTNKPVSRDCDFCKKPRATVGAAIWMFIDGIPYDYCSHSCKFADWKVKKPNDTFPEGYKTQGFISEVNEGTSTTTSSKVIPFPNQKDFACDRMGCLRDDARIEKNYGGMVMHFCSMDCMTKALSKTGGPAL